MASLTNEGELCSNYAAKTDLRRLKGDTFLIYYFVLLAYSFFKCSNKNKYNHTHL